VNQGPIFQYMHNNYCISVFEKALKVFPYLNKCYLLNLLSNLYSKITNDNIKNKWNRIINYYTIIMMDYIIAKNFNPEGADATLSLSNSSFKLNNDSILAKDMMASVPTTRRANSFYLKMEHNDNFDEIINMNFCNESN